MDDEIDMFQVFVTEANDGLSEIEADLLTIEANGSDLDLPLVNRVFRAIHSIKGNAGFISLTRIGELAHSMENVLSLIREQLLIPTSGVVEQLLRSADLLGRMVNDVHNPDAYDIDEDVAALKAIAAGEAAGKEHATTQTDTSSGHPRSAPSPQLTVDGAVFIEAITGGFNVFRYLIEPEESAHSSRMANLFQRLNDTGKILACSLTPDGVACVFNTSTTESFEVIHATRLTESQISGFCEIPPERIQTCDGSAATPGSIVPASSDYSEESSTACSFEVSNIDCGNAQSSEAQENPANQARSTHGMPKPSASSTSAGGDSSANIRVQVSVLDRLMNLAGELVLGRNQLLQVITNPDRKALETVTSRLDQVTSDLQEAIMATRMQPVGTVLSKFTRVVRDLSKSLGKQARLEIEGKDVELDKTIIEAIGDPLTHLVRNSMDHGLETPDVRTRKGKDPTGTILLKAMHQEGKVLLVISDDGAGIDADRIRRKAVEKGLLTEAAAAGLSNRDAVALIFAPGFSTAEQVSDVSGRGVGMDVVKTNIERLGGHVEIDTAVGTGTTITVRLPLTLAIIPSLIASCGGQRFAIPQSNISELVRVRSAERQQRIGLVNQAEVLRLRGTLLPLVRLRELLPPPATDGEQQLEFGHESPDVINVVVMEAGRLQFGLIVDRLHDSEEIVVKPLGRHLKSIAFLAGATILGDGRVAMILDAAGIAQRMNLSAVKQAAGSDRRSQGEDHSSDDLMETLLFSNHSDERFGIPMSAVLRLERVMSDQIKVVANRQVLQYRGGSLPLLALEDCIQARPRDAQDRLFVIIFRHGDRELGLITPQVLDIQRLSTCIDTETFREPGVLGSAVVDGHTVRFLDVYDLGNTQFNEQRTGCLRPDVVRSPHDSHDEAQADEDARRPRILYAEDSAFFRNKVKSFMEQAGWEVIACEDGSDAWERLRDPDFETDLLITDIEMPRMNGFELCELVRASGRWSDLPVIAITSLAGDADQEHGRRVGVSDYMVKLNRDQLLSTVSRHLGLVVAEV